MREYKEVSTIDLVKTLSDLKNKIELMTIEYDKILEELINRYPDLKNDESLRIRK